jgi:hypothetical protein
MTRRISLGAAAVFAAVAVRPMPGASQLGDEQWRHRFERSLAELYRFIMELNESRLDAERWQKVYEAWSGVVNAG